MNGMQNKSASGKRQRIAVIGSGITGLSAAWLLSRSADVTLYESGARPGGHSNTVDVEGPGGPVPVDTGFIVYNDRNYPNLVALFEHLHVPTAASDMSFSASLEDGGFEYSGSGFAGLLGQRRNALRPRFWSMLSDIMRFYREAPTALDRPESANMTLGAYLDAKKYRQAFVDDHILPMGAAIWSAKPDEMRAYPLQAFLRFFVNHGLLQLNDRPQWRTVINGSREYVSRLLAVFNGNVRLNSAIAQVRRDDLGVKVTSAEGQTERFDQIVIAAHADQALAMLADADDSERRLLGAFSYAKNTAVLHGDKALMPRRKAVWSSWNYIAAKEPDKGALPCVTYWMNLLQPLKTGTDLFVTLNPSRPIDESKIHKVIEYEHPLFDAKAISAQKQIWQIQGNRRTWFCGAYCGSGFHEDGLQAGLAVAEQLGGVRRPWNVENESGRIFAAPHKVAAE